MCPLGSGAGRRRYHPRVLDRIVEDVRRRLPKLIARLPDLEAGARSAPPVRDFTGALLAPGLSVIAEIKRASPSRGPLDLKLDAAGRAQSYERGGAAALSVLTEPEYFLAAPGDLEDARASVDLPVIRKDFTLHPIHITEARAMGADAVLLIVALLEDAALTDLLAAANEWGMAAIVEVHNEAEASRALALGATIVGVNNRDLTTFVTDIATSERIAPMLDGKAVTIGESGIHGASDARRVAEAGFDAVLIGEYLVKHNDPSSAIAEIVAAGR